MVGVAGPTWYLPLLRRYLASWMLSGRAQHVVDLLATSEERSRLHPVTTCVVVAGFERRSCGLPHMVAFVRRHRRFLLRRSCTSSRHRPLSAPIDVLADHGPTTLVADPLEGLNQRGEGLRQPVGVVWVNAPKRPGRLRANRKLSAKAKALWTQSSGSTSDHDNHLRGT